MSARGNTKRVPAVAGWSFDGEKQNQGRKTAKFLSITKGQRIFVEAKGEAQWWRAWTEDGTNSGLVPANYVKVFPRTDSLGSMVSTTSSAGSSSASAESASVTGSGREREATSTVSKLSGAQQERPAASAKSAGDAATSTVSALSGKAAVSSKAGSSLSLLKSSSSESGRRGKERVYA